MESKNQKENWQPKLLGFLCNWCSYAGADLAGSSRLHYPPTLRVIRVPCSGRVNPAMVLKAFKEGADGVLVAGCHPGDCHYSEGNYYTRRRLKLLTSFLPFVGIDPRRYRFEWISAAEGKEFAAAVEELTEQVRALGPNHPESGGDK